MKHLIPLLLCLLMLIPASFVMIPLAIWVKLDSPGPVFYRAVRGGYKNQPFYIMKFRTMKMDAPSDVPTHLLENPEACITRVGKILRKTSLDELPQIFQIFTGEMSIIGPRPALWNQFDLIEERDKYGANDVVPGLTGWAQINGRDELEIPVKAKLDGEYIEKFGLMMDIRCFFATFGILNGKGVVEGGTGELHRQEQEKK